MCDQENGLSHAKTSNSDDVTLPDDLSVSDDSESEEESGRGPFGPELRDLNPFDDDDEDDDDDDEGGGGEAQLGAAQGAQSCFSLKGGSSGFSSRSLSIFSCLDSVARPGSAAPTEESAGGGTFARPGRPPPKAVPDYLLHPERWTRYSLEDVPETSERQNSAVARQFLSGLQQRKQQQLDPPDSSCSSQHKVVFSRPSGRLGRERPAEEQKTAAGREMSLSHLEEEEEEEGGEGGSTSTRRSSEVKEKNTEKVKDKGGAVGHLDQEDEEKEEVKAPVKLPEAEERKRTWEQRGGAVEEREEENQQASAGFVSFRKSNRKNYRRSSEHEDS